MGSRQRERAKPGISRFSETYSLVLGLAAYKSAGNDGEPYVHRYELNKATALLKRLGAEIPKLPPYDPQKEKKLPWEDEVTAAIERLRSKTKARKPMPSRRKKR